MLVVRMHLWKSSGCYAYECCVFLLEVVRIGEARHVTCTFREIRMRVIRMIMRVTCYHEMCDTCSQEEGSLHNAIERLNIMVYIYIYLFIYL